MQLCAQPAGLYTHYGIDARIEVRITIEHFPPNRVFLGAIGFAGKRPFHYEAEEPAERRAVAAILQQEGYEVVEAANGKEAEAILADSEIELMITAIVMPEQDGLETIVFVRKSRPDVKIIAVSGDPADFHLRVAKLLGAHSAINKPLSREELIAAVQTLIGERRRGEGHLRA